MELILSAIKTGLSIAEVPSMELERRAGDSNLNAWKDGKRVLKTMIKERARKHDSTRANQAQIALAPIELAAHDTPQWRPRRHRPPPAASKPPKPTSPTPGTDRRSRPERTVTVLATITTNDTPISIPADTDSDTLIAA